MELINQTKTTFHLGLDKNGKEISFRINEVREFDDSLTKTLLRYEGINSVESLKAKTEKVISDAKAKSKTKK